MFFSRKTIRTRSGEGGGLIGVRVAGGYAAARSFSVFFAGHKEEQDKKNRADTRGEMYDEGYSVEPRLND